MQVLTNAAPAASPIPGIQHTTLAGSEQGLKQLSIWQQIVAPGGATPPHTHDCEEVVMCSAGRGHVLFGDGRKLEFRAHETLIIPAHELHQIVNSGDVPLHSIGVFGRSPVNVFLPDGTALDVPWPT
jgi:mannose-6-phosphate isomerase-like protein (cupin superfamily)